MMMKEMYKKANDMYRTVDDAVTNATTNFERNLFGNTLSRNVTMNDGIRYARNTALTGLLGLYIATQGCAGMKQNYTFNGVPLDDRRTADSGQTATDAGSKEDKKGWGAKEWLTVLGVAALGGIVYAVSQNDDDPAPASTNNNGNGGTSGGDI